MTAQATLLEHDLGVFVKSSKTHFLTLTLLQWINSMND
jgi:hypothetical protein